jgi:hypothetical protein
MARKRPAVARYLVIDVHFWPIPGQEFIDPAHGMTIRHALQDVLEIGERLDIVELCSGDKRTNDGPPNSTTI